MRQTMQYIAAIVVVCSAASISQAQQVGGEFIVGSQVISDVAVSQDEAAAATSQAPTPTADSAAAGHQPIYVNGAMVDGGCAGGNCASGNCASGNCQGCGSPGCQACAQGLSCPQALKYRLHGGHQGPYVPKQYACPDLFYNYYTNGQNAVNAELYLSPVPVPPFVGNTWVTYQPFMPHNYLYPHTDYYHNHYDYGRGTNRTRIRYSVSLRQYASTFYNAIRLPR